MIPDLSEYDLYALHWDERGQSITATFEGSLNDTDRQAWNAEPEHDWVVFHLKFKSVDNIRIRGWNYQLPISVTQTVSADRVAVVITGEGTDVRFTSAPAVLTNHHTYIWGPP